MLDSYRVREATGNLEHEAYVCDDSRAKKTVKDQNGKSCVVIFPCLLFVVTYYSYVSAHTQKDLIGLLYSLSKCSELCLPLLNNILSTFQDRFDELL